MAGHSHGKTVQPRKDAVNAKKTKMFTKIARQIIVAVKEGGSDIGKNIKLKQAISAAKKYNMPKTNVERAIKAAENNKDNDNFQELIYEGMGPDGAAFVIKILTDNRNRSASQVKTIFNQNNYSFGTNVKFLFQQCQQISIPQTFHEKVLEHILNQNIEGIVDIIENNYHTEESLDTEEEIHTLQLIVDNNVINQLRDILKTAFNKEFEEKIIWHPTECVIIEGETKEKIMNFLEKLEDLDDVQTIFTNFHLES